MLAPESVHGDLTGTATCVVYVSSIPFSYKDPNPLNSQFADPSAYDVAKKADNINSRILNTILAMFSC
jgi:hypothetical protein